MRNLIYILGDQLSFNISSLKDFSKKEDVILMTEVAAETTYVWHHKKKLVLILSAMRHFAEELKQEGYKVEYVKLDDEKNTGAFDSELKRFVTKYNPKKVILCEPSEYRVKKLFDDVEIDIEVREDNRFIASHSDFKDFAKGRKNLLMEDFYRQIRKKTGILVDEKNKPVGGKWNFDANNRNKMPDDVEFPRIIKINQSKITKEIIDLVEKKFAKNFGELENFNYAVSRDDTKKLFTDFVKNRLKNFGTYQDAMRDDLEFGFHSLISFYINIGLLDPLKCCKAVEKAYFDKKCDINSAEGFIRQIIGWREYIRGIYRHFMPKYKTLNFFNHKRKLPEFYWDENKTKMNCIKQVVKQTRKNAYSHHIQRLMITGNFAMLAEIDPDDVNEWYMAVYLDAFEWVELPNTHGMAIFADGGIVATKPYAASANYINKMSNFCKGCAYNAKKVKGEEACPFNFLYWNFLIKNKEKLKDNRRMFYPYLTLSKKSEEEVKEIEDIAENFLGSLR